MSEWVFDHYSSPNERKDFRLLILFHPKENITKGIFFPLIKLHCMKRKENEALNVNEWILIDKIEKNTLNHRKAMEILFKRINDLDISTINERTFFQTRNFQDTKRKII